MSVEVILPLGLNDSERDWMDRAYCKVNNIDMPLYFPPRGDSVGVKEIIAETCEQCEVREECLNYALNNFLSIGIFGGTTGRQRRQLQKERSEQSQGQGDKG